MGRKGGGGGGGSGGQMVEVSWIVFDDRMVIWDGLVIHRTERPRSNFAFPKKKGRPHHHLLLPLENTVRALLVMNIIHFDAPPWP
jgi:hypothetical protein